MQNAKDTFYVTLRNRLATLNPGRVMSQRGVQRPGIMVEEAEGVVAQMPADVFVLRWTELQADIQLPCVLAQMTCEIHYTTGGTQPNIGLDRGRAMSEMDAELLSILSPDCAQKMMYTQLPAVAMESQVFWGPAQFSALTVSRERLARIARVDVFAFQEQGEL
jgi:hypothetical protein